MIISAPFPWFGGKRKVASIVWQRFAGIKNYVEPFFGSGAVLLGRPDPLEGNETVNDLDGYVANFWRAVKLAPAAAAEYADNPVNENDLHARHTWLLRYREELRARLEGDPDWCDPKIAGWWVWGISSWIGSGFCSNNGPWEVIDGQLVHLGDNGRGVNRQLVHLGDNGRGVNRQLVHLGGNGQGVNRKREVVMGWFSTLSERLRNVRVCCGDWSRVCGPSPTFKHGLTGVLLDPPYGEGAKRQNALYRIDDATGLSSSVRDWALKAGQRPDMRIALCGYEGEHAMPSDWECVVWDAGEGYGSQATVRSNNGERERVWFSPACRKSQLQLFQPLR